MPDDTQRDEPTPGPGLLNGLRALAPTIDVDAAWAELADVFEHDRRRRRCSRLVAGVAACLVLAVLTGGVLVIVERDAERDLRVTDDGLAPSTTAVPTTSFSGVEPTILHVTCENGAGTATPTAVVAGPAGVLVDGTSVRFEPRDAAARTDQFMIEPGSPTPTADGSTVWDLAPGNYDVLCDGVMPSIRANVIGSVTVEDPNGYYVADEGEELSCSDRNLETYVRGDLTTEEFLDFRLGSAPRTAVGYREGRPRVVYATGARVEPMMSGIEAPTDQFSVWVCAAQHPLPEGDGLTAQATIRTREQAVDWLQETLSTPSSALYAIVDGAVLDAPEAKLVRQDEWYVGGEMLGGGLLTVAPGVSGWVVRVHYVTSDGIERAAVYRFAATGETRSLFRLGSNPPPAGLEWAAWFDALPDHAP